MGWPASLGHEDHQNHSGKKFGGSWCAEEAPGVAPCFPGPNGKQSAIDYAQQNRFGGSTGEIHVFDETGETIAEPIRVTIFLLLWRFLWRG